MIDAIVALIGASYVILVCDDAKDYTYTVIAECSDESKALIVRDALEDRIQLNMMQMGRVNKELTINDIYM